MLLTMTGAAPQPIEREAHDGVHQGESPRVVELQAGDALSRRCDRRFCEFSQPQFRPRSNSC